MTKVTKLDQKAQFIELRAKEVPYEKIAQELEVSKPTLIKWGRELETEISNRRTLELELLQEKYFVSKTKRIELYGEQLNRLNEELVKRDLSEIPTEKLYDMTMKTVASLKQEEVEIRLKEKGTFDDTIARLNDSFIEWRA
jgi:transposase